VPSIWGGRSARPGHPLVTPLTEIYCFFLQLVKGYFFLLGHCIFQFLDLKVLVTLHTITICLMVLAIREYSIVYRSCIPNSATR
jgi:hypothetical protein